MAQNVRINSFNTFQVAIESSMQDGAVEVKKEPLERSKALEDPEAVAEILVEIRRPKSTIESIVKTLEAEKFEESNIELFVEAAYEDADERV